ncbi:glycosyltransferase [Microbacterium sp. cf332]|uniref:glycosyltransferase n=1 Tax=Microbacterium sp. cf332 TaxID=1761804 RepID=UPI000887119F|nr:glycosyltransferase [Microbacterium sp. cf332]SDQ52149.1 Glycosyltransferase involved in cell wall bisynthesis [Microbacterium sp. cf332]
MLVLIPAYEPTGTLIDLIDDLIDSARVVVIDDGSGDAFAPVFSRAREAGAEVLTLATNRGKGAALRTGFEHVLRTDPAQIVVTADADGQHTPRDIRRVGEAVAEGGALVLGCRRFDGADVPARSRWGNTAARAAFRVAAGWALSDTQTGLRGIPPAMLTWLTAQPGDRFEYEQNVLLRCQRAGWRTREVAVDTVYIAGNESSHFRPLADSIRVGLPLLLFAASSLGAFVVDTLVMLLLTELTGWLVPSIIAARLLSASLNFAVNRRVFAPGRDRASTARAAARYAALAATLLASNVVWMTALTAVGLPLLLAKATTEAAVFALGYLLQRTVVFAPPRSAPSSRVDIESTVKAPLRNGEGIGTRMIPATDNTRRNP